MQNLILEVNAGIARLILNRPECLNSFNESLHQELASAFQQVSHDPDVRVILITGAGRAFCAGQDLRETS